MTVTDTAQRSPSADRRNRAERILTEMPEFDLRLTMELHDCDERKARAMRTVFWARERSVFCEGCRYDFDDGDVVYRKRGTPGWNPGPQRLQAYCFGCVSKWHPSWIEQVYAAHVCEGGCGVLVADWYGYEVEDGVCVSMYRVCSPHCSEIARNRRRRKAFELTCDRCGTTFAPRRSDSRFCSNACRQAAYRQRREDS